MERLLGKSIPKPTQFHNASFALAQHLGVLKICLTYFLFFIFVTKYEIQIGMKGV